MDLSLYIENKRITLFPDENVRLNRSVQSLRDLTKVFTDFTKEFSVPANDNNNAIFKHYYDAQIVNGFDARTKKDARIEIGGIVLKFGKIQLNSATLKSNVPVNYKIQFFGDTVKIKDLIGDDKLRDLDLSAYDHDYTPTNILNGLQGTLLSGNIKYPLLSYNRRFLWQDAQQDDDQNINIKYDAAFTSGVNWRELKPAIKTNAILQAISDRYGLVFSDDFFAREEFSKLYMTLSNGKDDINPLSSQEIVTYNKNVYQRAGTYSEGFIYFMRARVVVNSGDADYKIVFTANGQRVYESNITQGSRDFTFRTGIAEYGVYDFGYFIEAEGVLDVSINCYYETQTLPFSFRADQTETDNDLVTVTPQLIISDTIADMKVLDWFAAIIKAFNLVIVPREDGTLYINDLPSWYNSGNILDVSEYVDIDTLEVSRGKLYKEINFGYEDQQSLLAEEYESQFGQQFGGFVNQLQGIASEDVLEIKLPFENPQFERLTDTQIQYGFIVDKELSSYKNKPFLLYIPNTLVTTDNRIGFSGDTYLPVDNIALPSHAINLTDGFAAQYNAELNEYNGSVLTDNWYSRFYQDYINDLFNQQRREFTINANLPITIASKLELNDRLIIKGDRYIIDNLDSNLLTGVSKLVLLNDIFTELNVGDISKVSQSSGEFTDRGAVYYTGGEIAAVYTDEGWINLASNVVRSGENIEFTLDANTTGQQRFGLIQIQDNLSNPTVTIIQAFTGLITADNTLITADNTNITI